MKCNLCDRSVSREYCEKPENSVRNKKKTNNLALGKLAQSAQFTERTSSQGVRKNTNNRFCDICKKWISKLKTAHDSKAKTHKKN